MLEEEGTIDVLKLETEGVEGRSLAAASPELLSRVGVIFAEDFAKEIHPPPGFRASRRESVLRLSQPDSAAARS